MRILFLAAFCCVLGSWSRADDALGFYRSPAISRNTIVFVSEGDLWRVNATGGLATRLTTHVGWESMPAISPDGREVAFVAIMDGKAELYTMPLDGGVPVRHTFNDASPRFVSWTADGKLLFSTEKFSSLPDTQLATLNPHTNATEVLPLSQASAGCYGPDGTLFFVRLPKQTSATKRYRGGWIENLWRFKPGDAEAVRLEPADKSTSRSPMFWKDRVYFVSDRDGILNLWSMKPDGTDVRQHTQHKDFDVRNPSLDAGRIVYRLGADLRLYDIVKGTDTVVNIRIASDFDQRREQWVKRPAEYLTSWDPSPDGERIALTARGEVFVATFNPGRLVNIPRDHGVRYRNATFLPDNKTLLLQSDATGEIEFWKVPANGTEPPQQLTTDGRRFRFGPKPSPDGKWFAWADKDLKLWVRNIERCETRLVATSSHDEIFNDYEWSPNSQWIAFVDEAANTFKQIKLYHVTDGRTYSATSDRTNSWSPAWSPDGKFLFFLSDRDLKTLVSSPWGALQPEPFYTDKTKIYFLRLLKGDLSPFRPRDELSSSINSAGPARPKSDDETRSGRQPIAPGADSQKPGVPEPVKPPRPPAPAVPPAKPEGEVRKAQTADESKKDDKGIKPVTKPAAPKKEEPKPDIDLNGLMTRVEEVPLSAGNYDQLSCSGRHLFYTAHGTGFNPRTSLHRMEISNKRTGPNLLVDDCSSYQLCAKDGKMVVRRGDMFWVIDSGGPAPASLSNSAELNGWSFAVDPREEWRQIFHESWRMLRDYFYDRDMHGLDWRAIRRKYEPLIDRVTERSDLNEILQDLLGELTTLHIFVRSGDDRDIPDVIDTATLGAAMERDEPGGGWRVGHLWKFDPDYPSQSPPLSRPGTDVREGDIITRINGRATLTAPHIDAMLRNLAGKQVMLDIKSGGKNRQVIVKPISDKADADLRYNEWEYTRRLKVEELGKGQIGYVHLRAMGQEDMAQWARDFYPVFNRQGLIIDVRHNHGGNIDSWVLEKLLRKAWSYFAHAVGSPDWNMQYAFRGHVTVICDQKTASDGEGFTEGFRRLGLGKVIGTRTWGGNIWLSAQKWLVDSGMATAAEMGVYSPEGKWLIEGEGLHPDIEVDNLPHQTFLGQDAQLEAAVKHLQGLIAKDPRPVPPVPPRPKKVFSDDDKKPQP